MLSAQDQIRDTTVFWNFIRRNFRLLVLYAFVGGVLAFLLSLFIPKEYKSYGIVYPPSSTSIENSIDYPNFGYDVEADRLMQILESREIRDSVISKYHLRQYYRIDSARADWHDAVLKEYYKDVQLERSTSMAVIITAKSRDPKTAAAMVNYIINLADAFREKLYKRNLASAFEEAQTEYRLQQAIVDSLEEKLNQHLKENNLSSLLLLYSDAQISLDLSKIGAHTASSAGIGAEILNYKGQFEIMKEARANFLKLRKTILNPIPKIFVLSFAEPLYKKISPSYSLSALIGAVLGLFISVAILLIRQTREPN